MVQFILFTLISLLMLGCGPKYTAKNGTVYKDGTPLPLYGVNWFGFETCDCAPHGLWSGRSIEDILSQLKALGFNAIRLPVGPEVLRNNCITPSWVKVGEPNYPEEPFDGLKYFLSKAKDEGFYVLLDLHTFKCDLINKKLPGMPFDPNRGYTKEDWLSDLRRMARLSLEFSNIFAIDLFNEPYLLTWEQWSSLVKEGGMEVLRINPRVLISVNGVGDLSYNGGYGTYWGENLTLAVDHLGLGDSIIYMPHVYGPSVHYQSYFNDPNFPENMPTIWNIHFGHLTEKGIPWGVGEFGGWYEDKDKTWQDRFVDYLKEKRVKIWFYWSLNPNSEDTGGILQEDWKTPVEDKINLLKRLMDVK